MGEKYDGPRQCKRCGGLTFAEPQVGSMPMNVRCSSCGDRVFNHAAMTKPDWELLNAGVRRR